MDTVRAFFTKSGHFFLIFKIGQGRPPPPPPNCAPVFQSKIINVYQQNINKSFQTGQGKCNYFTSDYENWKSKSIF